MPSTTRAMQPLTYTTKHLRGLCRNDCGMSYAIDARRSDQYIVRVSMPQTKVQPFRITVRTAPWTAPWTADANRPACIQLSFHSSAFFGIPLPMEELGRPYLH